MPSIEELEHRATLAYMCKMYDLVAARHDRLSLADCKFYLSLLADPACADAFYNPVVGNCRYRYKGHGTRVLRAALNLA